MTDPRADAIVRAVIDLAHALNVTTVAEGVENADAAAWLLNCGWKWRKESTTAHPSQPAR